MGAEKIGEDLPDGTKLPDVTDTVGDARSERLDLLQIPVDLDRAHDGGEAGPDRDGRGPAAAGFDVMGDCLPEFSQLLLIERGEPLDVLRQHGRAEKHQSRLEAPREILGDLGRNAASAPREDDHLGAVDRQVRLAGLPGGRCEGTSDQTRDPAAPSAMADLDAPSAMLDLLDQQVRGRFGAAGQCGWFEIDGFHEHLGELLGEGLDQPGDCAVTRARREGGPALRRAASGRRAGFEAE